MFTDYSVFDPRCARPLCDALYFVRRPDALHGVPAQLLTDGIRADSTTFLPETTLLPNRCYVQAGGDFFAFIDGTSSLAQLQNIVTGYTLQAFGSGTGVFNGAVFAAYTAIINEIAALLIVRPQRVYLVGWSYGGAIAQLLAFPLNWLYLPAGKVNVCSFGAPKYGGQAFAATISGITNNARWMNANDPIPIVPPNINQSGIFALTLGVASAIRMGYFVHACGGLNLVPDGTITESYLPSLATISIPGSLAAMIRSWVQGQDNDHSLSTYSSRLQLAADDAGNNPLVPPKRSEQPVILQNQEARREGGLLELRFRRFEHAQHRVPVTIPPRTGFYVVRQRPLWAVFLNKDQISLHSNKKSARHLARAGNDFFASALHSGLFDQATLVLAAQEFFALSKDSVSGIVPAVQDVPPM
jgi:pimeloyl-ACP methyl ester carboxylesterase